LEKTEAIGQRALRFVFDSLFKLVVFAGQSVDTSFTFHLVYLRSM